MRTNKQSNCGFTITEVLVTISILSVLVGLLLPAIGSMKTAARQAQCQANLRQMAIAATAYTTIWDAYPAALRYEQVDGVAHRIAWDWVTTFSGQVIGPGALWQFSDNPDRVMQCPGYHGPSNFNGDPHTGYNYNTDYLAGEAAYVEFGWDIVRRGTPPHACRLPSRTAIFGLGGYSGGANKFMRSPDNPNNTDLWSICSGAQARRYGDATNVAYLDGHVQSIELLHDGPGADNEQLRDLLGAPENGFLTNDGSAYDPRNPTPAGAQP